MIDRFLKTEVLTLKSNCCQADLLKSSTIDYFHGADDDYELKVPVMICSQCESSEQLVFSGQ
ncbi:hypothetical protein [Robertmurraya kyonggiensis]|uniref:hypothetical protein n=1 Tax=Robertmurraya kyonggiensis TaxID=1037680 RepID=UPI00130E2ADA|nr:hypothetical protein [Robertmurraya kyonggiensis]